MKILFAATLLVLFARSTFSQPPPAFDVASVKYNQRTAGSWCRFLPGGRLEASSWVKQLIQIAWDVQNYQVSGGPDWLTTDWYDIDARACSADAGRPEMLLMLQSLLADRFKLQLRHETKEFPIYELKVDKGGFKLKPMAEGEKSRCGRDNSFACGFRTLPQLAKGIENFVGRPVIDKTGIDGNFDLLLDFDYYSIGNQTPPPGFDKPSLPTALQNQIGVHLEPAKTTFPMLIVESIQRPTGN